MDIVQNVEPAKVVIANNDADQLEKMFEELIQKNYLTDSITIGNLTFVLKPLSTGEFLEADTVYIASVSTVPRDVVDRVRLVSTLCYAIESVNGLKIAVEDREKERESRSKLHSLLMKLPPTAIDIIHEKYKTLIDKQNDALKDMSDKIENF